MANRLPASLLSQLSLVVAAQTGLHFPQERWCDLERGICAAAGESGVKDAVSYGLSLLSVPWRQDQVDSLVRHLTVGETYFFRERATFETLRQHILPGLIRARHGTDQRLRIWSAGCCTGEESYSIAILLSQLLPDWQDWQITLLATDVNSAFLRKAAVGEYGEWSFRDVPTSIKELYFRRTKTGHYTILPEVKQMVTFSSLNLMEGSYLSRLNQTQGMDLIFCRNVLMYFASEQAKTVIQALYHSLTAGGWLIVGASEASSTLFGQFALVNFAGATLYRKAHPGRQNVAELDDKEHALDNPLDKPQEMNQKLAGPPAQLVRKAGFSPTYRTARVLKAQDSQFAPRNPTESMGAFGEEPAQTQPASFGEAVALYEQGRPGLAAEKLNQLLAQTPQDVDAMMLLARIYANQRKLSEALGWCEKVIAIDRLNAATYYLQATIQEEQGQAEQAAQSLKRVLYLAPDFLLAHFALGTLMLRRGQVGEANKCFANTLALLSTYRAEEPLAESIGFTSGRLRELIGEGYT